MTPRRWTVERVDPAPASEKRVAELEAALKDIAHGRTCTDGVNQRPLDRFEMRSIAQHALKGEQAK